MKSVVVIVDRKIYISIREMLKNCVSEQFNRFVLFKKKRVFFIYKNERPA